VDKLRRLAFPVIPMIIVALGIFGLFYRFWNDPSGLIKQLMWIGLLVAAFYLLYKLLQKRQKNKEFTSYMKAVKQSKKLHHKTKPTKKTNRPTALKKKRSTHLTVIEGKKGKKKNRAFF
jgi:hypothetical protein